MKTNNAPEPPSLLYSNVLLFSLIFVLFPAFTGYTFTIRGIELSETLGDIASLALLEPLLIAACAWCLLKTIRHLFIRFDATGIRHLTWRGWRHIHWPDVHTVHLTSRWSFRVRTQKDAIDIHLPLFKNAGALHAYIAAHCPRKAFTLPEPGFWGFF